MAEDKGGRGATIPGATAAQGAAEAQHCSQRPRASLLCGAAQGAFAGGSEKVVGRAPAAEATITPLPLLLYAPKAPPTLLLITPYLTVVQL